MIHLGFALTAALAAASGQSGVKWTPLNSPKATQPREAPAPDTSAPAPNDQFHPEAPAVAASPAAAPAASAPPIAQGPLHITCFGEGTADKKKVARSFGTSSFSGSVGTTGFSGSGSSQSWTVLPHDRQFKDQVDVRLFSGDDRIRMFRSMLPPLRGGKHGWFKLKNIVADARSIRASAAVNIINNPKVFIDRVTGTISISGKAGDYSGQCEAIDTNATAKF